MYATLVPFVTLACLVFYFLFLPIYQYFRDDKGLRKYPSVNWLAGITNIGFMYEAFKGRRSKTLAELHKEHPVIRIGPNSLSFKSVQAIKDIYGHGTPCTKDYFYSALSGTHFHLADVIDKHDHARKRKNLAAAYAIKNLETWEHKVADKVQRLIKACDAACTGPLKETVPAPEDLTFDYFNYANFFTEDAIVDIGLSERLGFLDQGSDECVAERMDGTLFRASYRKSLHNMATAQSRIIWAYDWFNFNKVLTGLVSKDFARMWELNKDWDGILYHRAKKRLARYQAGEKLDDFFQVIMEDKNGQAHNLPWGEIVAEISIMMNAGSDTTAIAMSNAIYLLLKHPQALKKLREEIDANLDADEVVAPYDKVKHLPYLRAVIDETLRMMPPVSFNLPRRTPAEGMMVASEYIAGDTSVSISAEVAHRDPDVFANPDSFIPERWLGDKGRELQAGFVAFSAGARGCIGRNITYLEQTMLLASVVHRYEMALPSGEWEPMQFEGTTTHMKELPLKVWRREAKSLTDRLLD
ncbi:hypothetical protein G7054_g10530 [Neopestalotiopsis clavispora]|nr:hypothetical protein G7054_g10530 [Neopestalotiopsis clavispora]